MSRNLERSMARSLYAKFAKRWRQEQRLSGVYDKPGYKRPKFNEWYQMYQQHVLEQAKVHAPAPELQYVGPDPWIEGTEKPLEERGVVTIDMATGEEERNG